MVTCTLLPRKRHVNLYYMLSGGGSCSFPFINIKGPATGPRILLPLTSDRKSQTHYDETKLEHYCNRKSSNSVL